MSKEQIEEMACDMCTVIQNCNEPYKPIPSCEAYQCAKRAYAKGWRKQSKTEKLENKLFSDALETVLFSLVYLGGDGKWHIRRNNAEKTTAIVERFLALVSTEKGADDEQRETD